MDTYRHFLSLVEIAKILRYKTTRSASNWCKRNGVAILSGISRGKYVLNTEFRLRYLDATISHLRRQYGETHWRDALEVHLNDDLLGLIQLIKCRKHEPQRQASEPKKRTVGENEKRFAEELQNLAQ